MYTNLLKLVYHMSKSKSKPKTQLKTKPLDFDYDSYHWKADIDYRKNP